MKKFFVGLILLSFQLIFSSIIHIPADFSQIQAGIDVASPNDTVLVSTGFYSENLDFLGKSITVASHFLITQNSTYIPLTVIEAATSSNPVVVFDTAEDSLSALIGFTLIDGNGGILCQSASPRLQNLIIQNNDADQEGGGIACFDSNPVMQNISLHYNSATGKGGGLFLQNSTIFISNLTVLGNSSEDDGGGIYLEDSQIIINAGSVCDNSADYGGGIYSQNSSLQIFNCSIDNNICGDDGGGLYLIENSDLSLQNGTVNGNECDNNGGGIFCQNSGITFDNVEITGNLAPDEGGGFFLESSSAVLLNVYVQTNSAVNGGGIFSESSEIELTGADFHYNYAEEEGGGIALYLNSALLAEDCRISRNESGDDGGGVYCEDSDPQLFNCSLEHNNSAHKGGGLYLEAGQAVISDLYFFHNQAVNDGGAIYIEDSTADIHNLTAIYNISGEDGGAIASSSSDLTIRNGLFTENQAVDDGTIYLSASSQQLFYNLTIADNLVGDKGSAVYCSGGNPSLINCLVANNLGSRGFYLVSGDASIIYSNFYNNENGNFHGFSNNIGVNVTVNANNAPCDQFYNIQLNPFFDVDGGYPFALLNNSPCINAGSPDVVPLPLIDLAGNPRVYGQFVEMGAYENQNVWIVSADNNCEIPAGIKLSNYPNPFNPTTTISFSFTTELTGLRQGYARQAENTEIVIYNLKGQKVKVFSNLKISQSSNHQIIWDGTDGNNQPVSSGIYFARLRAGKIEASCRMLLLK